MLHQSKVEVYIHFVWATLGRAALLEGPLQRTVYRTIRSKAEDLGCIVLAIGGMPDHVHVVLRTPSTVSPATVAREIKCVSSLVARKTSIGPDFAWQTGYGAFSLDRQSLDTAISYVHRQRNHHNDGDVWTRWEETDEEVPGEGGQGLSPPSR